MLTENEWRNKNNGGNMEKEKMTENLRIGKEKLWKNCNFENGRLKITRN